MHLVHIEIIDLHRPKRIDADVQSDGCSLDSVPMQSVEDLGREVKSGSGRRSASVHRRVDGLVTLAIGEMFVNIGRQGSEPDRVESLVQAIEIEESQSSQGGAFGGLRDFRVEPDPEAQLGPEPERLGRLDYGFVHTRGQLRQQEGLYGAAGFLLPDEPRGGNPRVIHNEEIARKHQLGDVAEVPVLDSTGLMKHQEPRGRSIIQRKLRNELLGQVVVVIAQALQISPSSSESE